jgi:POT family proton-dependent oligopeptide transporter
VTTTPQPPAARPRWPVGVPFIIGNEAAERFSFYGMKAILFVYLAALLQNFQQLPEASPVRKAAEDAATHHVHLFVAGVYAFPMLGALVADRLLGKYPVIFWLSLVYCVGHGVLAVAGLSANAPLFYFGLALIALGSGGIKPCVSANVGDQFDASNASLVPKVYQIFYFSINFGSFFSTLMTPKLYKWYGPDVAFGIPGVLMLIATVIFWMGRGKYTRVPPKPGGSLGLLDVVASAVLFVPIALLLFGTDYLSWAAIGGLSVAAVVLFAVLFIVREQKQRSGGFFSVVYYALRNQHQRQAGEGFFSVARPVFGEEVAEGPVAVMKIAVVFSMVSVFWALFDQHASSWVNQAQRMDLHFAGMELEASQISALNPVMVMAIIPLLNFVVYPLVERLGITFTPLRRMTVGMFLASAAFVIVALLQARIDAAPAKSVGVAWQVIPYLVMTMAEVLVSVTGLEFAYTQAPKAMKSTIMGFWLLTVSLGNKLVAVLSGFEGLPLTTFFWIFAGLMAVAALIFAVLAYFYKGKTYLQGATA